MNDDAFSKFACILGQGHGFCFRVGNDKKVGPDRIGPTDEVKVTVLYCCLSLRVNQR
jgi:hypothetical protein